MKEEVIPNGINERQSLINVGFPWTNRRPNRLKRRPTGLTSNSPGRTFDDIDSLSYDIWKLGIRTPSRYRLDEDFYQQLIALLLKHLQEEPPNIPKRWDKMFTIYKKRNANSLEEKDCNKFFEASCLRKRKEKKRWHFILNRMRKSKNPHRTIYTDVQNNSPNFTQDIQKVSIKSIKYY